jgi:hypothetical protein
MKDCTPFYQVLLAATASALLWNLYKSGGGR